MFRTTKIQRHKIGAQEILVKREDLCGPDGAPPFSKIRGLIPALTTLKKSGITTIGYTETSISMAGWGVAWACKILGLKAVIFDPQYKKTPALLKYHRKQWVKYGAEIVPVKAGMAKVNWYISRKILIAKYPTSHLLPLGLPFPETIKETAAQAKKCFKRWKPKTVVVNVGSGTICAGVLRGTVGLDIRVYGVMGRTGNINQKQKLIYEKASPVAVGKGLLKNCDLRLIDEGWEYTQPSKAKCPFPCHPFYDLKAWEWLTKKYFNLRSPIMFWNIGKVK